MDSNFNFSALLRMQTYENKHKVKPTQFISVAGGVKKRLESNIKNKRRTRLTNFDNFRNLPLNEPAVPEPLNKIQQRKLQLQKWKMEKERKKVEAMAKKKKPFVVGTAQHTLKFEPPPAIAWPLPSTSGRVTRSQTVRNNITSNKKEKQKLYMFAPQNAIFNPTLKDFDRPTLTTFEQEEFDLHKKQISKFKSPNNVPKQEPRSLRSRTKLTEEDKGKQAQNELNTQKQTMPKKKLTKQPLQKKKAKPKPNFSSTASSSDSDTYSKETAVLKVSSVKKNGTLRKVRKSVNSTKKAESSKTKGSTTVEKLVDLSIYTSNMETDSENALNSPEVSIPKATDTPNKLDVPVQDFITFTPKNPVPKSESNSEEKLRSTKSLYAPMTPQQIQDEAKKISPRVYLSRGKENTRKEMKKRINDGLLDEDACDMSVEHFRRQLDSEIKRMTEMCEEWDKIIEQVTLPDEVQEAALAAVGQARSLMSQKLQQFATLLRRCEAPEPRTALVTRADLQGFWDMVFLQVENVDIRFKKLEQGRACGWTAEEPCRKPCPSQSKPPVRVSSSNPQTVCRQEGRGPSSTAA